MANFNTFKSVNDLLKAFPTEQSCIRYLERKLWPNGFIVSPYDPTSKVYRRGDGMYRCKNIGMRYKTTSQNLVHRYLPCNKYKEGNCFNDTRTAAGSDAEDSLVYGATHTADFPSAQETNGKTDG